MKIRDTFRRSVIVLVAVLWVTVQSQAQDTPLISGGIGFLTATKGGNTSYFPTAQPLIAFPLGSNLLVEGRAALLEDFSPEGNGQADYSHFHYVALSYLQLDYIATAHATVVGGEFLTPFGTYNERLTPIWISNFEDAPLILSLGNGTGSSVGGMVRGSFEFKVLHRLRSVLLGSEFQPEFQFTQWLGRQGQRLPSSQAAGSRDLVHARNRG